MKIQRRFKKTLLMLVIIGGAVLTVIGAVGFMQSDALRVLLQDGLLAGFLNEILKAIAICGTGLWFIVVGAAHYVKAW